LPGSKAHDNCQSAVPKHPIKTVGLIVKADRPAAVEIARSLTKWLGARRKKVIAEPRVTDQIDATTASREDIARRADLSSCSVVTARCSGSRGW